MTSSNIFTNICLLSQNFHSVIFSPTLLKFPRKIIQQPTTELSSVMSPLKITLGSSSPLANNFLIGTIGSSTVEIKNNNNNSSSKYTAFVRAPTQLGGGGGGPQQSESVATSCATGEVVFTLVRAPFAFSRNSINNTTDDDDEFFLKKQIDTQKQMQLSSSSLSSGPSSLVLQHQEASSLLQMIRKAIDKSILKEALPLARFELVVQILSSVDDDSDFVGITSAACGALIDANIPLKDVFGAGCSSSSSSSSSTVRMIIAGHSKSVLGLQISNNKHSEEDNSSDNGVENLCQSIEKCCESGVKETLRVLQLAAAEKVDRLKVVKE